MKRIGWSCLLLAIAAIASRPALADDFRSARTSDVRGNLSVRGPDDDDVSYIERNAVIRHGDVLWTDEDGRAEIELERGAWVRLAENTKLEVRGLPPSAEFRLWTGSVYLDLSDRVQGRTLLKTPVGDLELERDSVARVDLDGAESARFSLYNGRGLVIADSGASTRLGPGERVYLDLGKGTSEPQRFDRGDQDGFDRYQRDRVDYFINRPLPRELREDIVGASDLHDYGSWVVVENTTYWRPRCEPDWRPYSAGYWSYIPGCGYTWIDYAPWGYTTSHYGRWLYRPVYGWLWSPGYRWAPAYVYWGSYGNYCGWAPLDPWDRPCYFGNSGFSLTLGLGNLFIDARSWTFCPQDRFYYGRHHRYYARGGRSFFGGHEVNLRRDGFRAFRDAHREIGVPRNTVRGVTTNDRGMLARDRVLRLEDRLPEGRGKLIESRFKVAANRDRELVRRGGEVERFQRDPNAKIDNGRLLRGDDAARDALRRTPRSEDRDLARDSRTGGRNGLTPGGAPAETTRDRNSNRSGRGPADGRDVARERGSGSNDRAGVDRGEDRDRSFRRGTPGVRDDRATGGTPAGRGNGGTPLDRGRSTGRAGDPSFNRGTPGSDTGRGSTGRDGTGSGARDNDPARGGDRDDRFRRGSGSRPNDPLGRSGNVPRNSLRQRIEGSRPGDTVPRRETSPRPQPEPRETPRGDSGRRDTERRDSDRREGQRRSSVASPFGSGTAPSGIDRSRPDDRFRRGGTSSGPSYQDFRGPSGRTPSGSRPTTPSGTPSTTPPTGAPSYDRGSTGRSSSPGAGRSSGNSDRYSRPSYDRGGYSSPSRTPSTGAPSGGSSYSRPGYDRGSYGSPGRSSSPGYSSPSGRSGGYSSPGRSYSSPSRSYGGSRGSYSLPSRGGSYGSSGRSRSSGSSRSNGSSGSRSSGRSSGGSSSGRGGLRR